jgi:hypothetical protein
VATPRAHADLLRAAGFVDIGETDLTADFLQVARAWIRESDAHRDGLVELLGAADFEERQAERRTQLRAVEEGLLCRSLFVARRPPSYSEP